MADRLTPDEIARKAKEYQRAYYIEHRDRKMARSKARYAEKRAEILEQSKVYRDKNKEAIVARRKAYYLDNKEAVLAANRKWYEANREYAAEMSRKWRSENSERAAAMDRARYLANRAKGIADGTISPRKPANPEKCKETKKRYREANIDRYRKYHREYAKDRRASDPCFALAYALRIRIAVALRKKGKHGSAVRDLGCSIGELKAYLESQFLPGMSWSNRGLRGWHIDHIRPLASFDLTDPEQFRAACHYTNLQPMWAVDNMKKGAKVA